MRNYQNPFRIRASEQQGDPQLFLRHFGVGMLELLPETLWDRPLLLRSAPGGGKTSLMRLFTLDSLRVVHERRSDVDFKQLAHELAELKAIDRRGPLCLGVLLNLERDYRSLVDLDIGEEASVRLFFRLLDARIMVAVMRAALQARGFSFPADCGFFELRFDDHAADAVGAAAVLGGHNGGDILEQARRIERDTLLPLDSLLPIELELPRGGSTLLSLRVLSESTLVVDGTPLRQRPLVMLDDGHYLEPAQRLALLSKLTDRNLSVGRWYSERYEALANDDLMHGAINGRDFELIELENSAREARRRVSGRSFDFERVMIDVANRRAATALERYGNEAEDFSELVDADAIAMPPRSQEDLASAQQRRLELLIRDQPQYDRWLAHAADARGYARATRLRAIEIAIEQHRRRQQRELFAIEPTREELDERLSRVAAAARLFLAREQGIPYYYGSEMLAKLGSQNMEQFLSLCGDVFEQMLALITLRKKPLVEATKQEAVVLRASDALWAEIPRRVPAGHEVQRLLEAIAALGQHYTYKPTAPYAPGVTGIAITMQERRTLLNVSARGKVAGGSELFEALASAFAHNILSAQLNYKVQGKEVMVIYFNRLLCPRFSLPLGYGGFRIRGLDEVAGWMVAEGAPTFAARDEEFELEVAEPEQLAL
jgi:hypothetical protein